MIWLTYSNIDVDILYISIHWITLMDMFSLLQSRGPTKGWMCRNSIFNEFDGTGIHVNWDKVESETNRIMKRNDLSIIQWVFNQNNGMLTGSYTITCTKIDYHPHLLGARVAGQSHDPSWDNATFQKEQFENPDSLHKCNDQQVDPFGFSWGYQL